MPARPHANLPRDMRGTPIYREVEAYLESVHKPAFGRPSHAAEVCPNPVDGRVAMTVQVRTSLEEKPRQRVAVLEGADLRVLTDGDGDQRLPRWSPDGTTLAWLSDHERRDVAQLQLLHPGAAAAVAAPAVEGAVEWFSWSPDGRRVLLGVAEPGADQAGGMGSGTVGQAEDEDLPSWLPEVEGPTRLEGWRRAMVLDVGDGTVRTVSRGDLNVWEADWKGTDALVAVCSDGDPDEGAWYTADLRVIELAGEDHVLHSPHEQLGLPTATPDGSRVAVVEAVCSDRWIVAGDLVVVEEDGSSRPVDTAGIDVTDAHWLDEARIGVAGLRGLRTVLAVVDLRTGAVTEQLDGLWTTGDRYPAGAWWADGTAVVARHAYDRFPELVSVSPDGTVQVSHSLRHPGADVAATSGGTASPYRWTAPDGLEIEGILVLPDGDGPFPLVMIIHGGPIWAFTSTWGMFYGLAPQLAARGFAVLHPNPRGSAGCGQAFARHVVGDMGGADTHDLLSGLDALVADGIADPDRIVATGGSYGGFMTAWLITQDQRFAAAAPVAPVTDWYSQHHTSNLQAWDHTFLDGQPRSTGLFHQRSPVMHTDSVTTPTLTIAGLQDRCTPPTQAVEFHRALREVGVETHLALYPEEGHGVRNYPAVIDYQARLITFFTHHTT